MDNLNNSDKLTEKAFTRLIATSVLGIIICMGCLCSATWAWFSDSVRENSTQIVTAREDLTVSVIREDGTAVDTDGLSDGYVILNAGTYTLTLTRSAGSSSGYFVLRFNDVSYYSDGVIRDPENDVDLSATYSFTVPSEASVTLETRWGIYSGETVIKRNDGSISAEAFVIPVVSAPATASEG